MDNSERISAEKLAKFDPISSLANDQIEELAAQTPVEQLPPGTTLFKQGDDDSHSLFLISGSIRLSDENQVTSTLTAGNDEAKNPVSNHFPRRVTAVTETPVTLIRLDKDMLDAMVIWGQLASAEPEVVMTEDGIFTIDKASWLKKMVKSPTFKHLPPANIEQLLDKLEPIKVNAGEVIIRQGDQGDYFYMIDQGNALVNRQTEDEEEESIELAELTEGSSFGEAALISDKPRNATVSMMSDGILLRLSKDDFLTLLNEPNVQWITHAQAQQHINTGTARWLDIRLSREYDEGHLDGAINIPVQQLHRKARELDKSVSYICYCDSGRRSSAASFVLKQYGLEAFVLQGGTEALPEGSLVK